MLFTPYVLVAIAVWISGVDATQISTIDSQGQYSTAVHSQTPENARPVSPSRQQDPNFDASTELGLLTSRGYVTRITALISSQKILSVLVTRTIGIKL